MGQTITESQLATALKNAGISVFPGAPTASATAPAEPAPKPVGQVWPKVQSQTAAQTTAQAAPLTDAQRITNLETRLTQLEAKLSKRLANF